MLLSFWFMSVLVALVTAGGGQEQQGPSVLIFSRTTGYRHDSIPIANAALKQIGPSHNIIFDVTEDPTTFTVAKLSKYDALLFMMTTDAAPDDLLNTAQLDAFQEYLDMGGNFVGIHSASACMYNNALYKKQIGAYFNWHPEAYKATFLNTLEPNHPTVKMIPKEWSFVEEVYSFSSDPRKLGAKVVLTVKYNPATDTDLALTQGDPHPIAWYQERAAGVSESVHLAGRSFYTSLGHEAATWKDETFLAHIMAGIKWVLDGKTTMAFSKSGVVGNAAGYGVSAATSTPASSSQAPSTQTASSTSIKTNTTSGAYPVVQHGQALGFIGGLIAMTSLFV